MKKLIYFLTLCSAFSCESKKPEIIKYQNGHQVLSLNNSDRYGNQIPTINVLSLHKDTIKQGGEFHAKLFLDNQEYTIVNARFDCNVSNESLVDTSRNKIIGCNKGLMIKSDTVHIQFTVGGQLGNKSFDKITLLSKGADNIFRYHKTSFNYFVIE